MPPPNSILEQIILNVKSTLEGVTIANGFDLDIVEVHRLVDTTISYNDLPYVVIEEQPETKSPARMPDTHYEVFLPIALQAWCLQVDQDVPIASLTNLLLANIEKAIMVDRSRGLHEITSNPLAMDTALKSNAKDLSLFDEPYGGVRVDIEVRYRHLVGDPFNC